MKYLKQIVYILLFTLMGQVLERVVPFPIPGAIYGLVLLFLALCTGLVKVERIKTVGNWLIGIMGIFFVAPVVNLLDSWAAVKDMLLPVLCITIVSTVAVFGAAGLVTQWLRRKGGSHD